tara:strand:+ start:1013 stop:1351 length:339 start_codon:yes stop_codon:yes gene_type:complete
MSKNENILKLLLLMAFADKKYMEEEKELIFKISSQLNVPNEKVESLIDEIEKIKDYTKVCRETSKEIIDKSDREKTIQLLSEMIASDKIVHKKELFAYQIIAEEWNMYRGND